MRRAGTAVLKLGAIDSAAAALMPQLMQLLREAHPEIETQLIEQKTIHLLPKLLSGGVDIAFCRTPDFKDPRLHFHTLFFETAVVALQSNHPLANLAVIHISDLADEPLIVPDRRSRPHSHDLTIKLFVDAGLPARIAQVAEEKHTIVNLVATGTGVAIVPRWTSRLKVEGVTFVPIAMPERTSLSKLVLAAAWPRGIRDPMRDAVMAAVLSGSGVTGFADLAGKRVGVGPAGGTSATYWTRYLFSLITAQRSAMQAGPTPRASLRTV